jgi:adenosylcobinamide amidohydrolase
MKLNKLLIIATFIPSTSIGFSAEPYIGGDISRARIGFKHVDDSYEEKSRSESFGFNLYSGLKFNDYFSFEGGIFDNMTNKKQDKKIYSRNRGGHIGFVANKEILTNKG